MTYKDGRQDVGFWHGERLLKLLTPITNAFSISEHPQFQYQPEDMSIPIMPQPDRTEPVKNVLEPPALFNYTPEVSICVYFLFLSWKLELYVVRFSVHSNILSSE